MVHFSHTFIITPFSMVVWHSNVARDAFGVYMIPQSENMSYELGMEQLGWLISELEPYEPATTTANDDVARIPFKRNRLCMRTLTPPAAKVVAVVGVVVVSKFTIGGDGAIQQRVFDMPHARRMGLRCAGNLLVGLID